ncbi:transposase [candidate division CSSED10-310 bacterium]|uniref:Transposase n=1 Tax=candidate division CSSED10-310 bacterium TaxID=2855610 RepID=A0ABV6Z6R5_UNCC1
MADTFVRNTLKSNNHTVSPDWETLIRKKGAQLPHWTCANAIYHVVLRLSDSLPTAVLEEFHAERQAIITNAAKMKRELTEYEEQRLKWLYSEKVEQYLDAGYGECYLRQSAIAELVQQVLQFFDTERYTLHCWCLMPNHVHVIVEPKPGFTLSKIKHSWTSYSATRANAILNRTGQFWQHEPYDHIIRNEKEYRFLLEYVWRNPEQAGLTSWKWRGIRE